MAEAKGRNTIIVQLDWLDDYSELTDEQFGQLMRAYLKYGKTREVTKFSSTLMRLAFNQVKRFAEYTLTKYEELCRRRAEWGKKGAQKKAKVSTSKHKPAEGSYIDIKDDNDIDIDNKVVVVVDNDNDNEAPEMGTVERYFHNNNYNSDPKLFHQYNSARNWAKLKDGATWESLADLWESREEDKQPKGGDPGDIGFSW